MKAFCCLTLLLVAAACGAKPDTPPPGFVAAADVSVRQFKSLNWLEGRWRGTLNDTMPFYESYHYVNDSTIQFVAFRDSSLTPKDTAYLTVRKGVVMNGSPDGGFVVTALSSDSAHFEPIGKARNAYTWRREADGSWLATLMYLDAAGNATQRTYVMRKLAK
jgi:hypothetical protein